jgi:hypothetical protein
MGTGEIMYYRRTLPAKIINHRKWMPAHIIAGPDGEDLNTRNRARVEMEKMRIEHKTYLFRLFPFPKNVYEDDYSSKYAGPKFVIYATKRK